MKDILFEYVECISKRTIGFFESKANKIIDKFIGGEFNLYNFKIKILLASMDLWHIVNISVEPPPFNVDFKVLKKYQRCVKKTMFIIGLNLADNQLTHIKSCKIFAKM